MSMKYAGSAAGFWDTIKLCFQGINLCIIMFAAYGYSPNSAGLSSPVHIPSMKENIIPFIKLLKITLLIRSQMSLSSANEPVLQAIVKNLLHQELSLVMNGKKPKGSGHFGYSDIFILSDTVNNYVILELKYISLVGFNINQKNNLGSKRIKITIGEILNNRIDQLNSYMKVISKGKATNYSSSGIFDRRIKVSKSNNPNKLKGFVVLVIGFLHFMEIC
ncbi:hypothetical protein RhiirA5_411350 [Rhizophagus irregularis]|uniref:Uncharacterized protein n=1 Tax=Rhizophagus irregularis TaxID=588596 RepID=A0A2N0Q1A0_9GLOM|nr:hypothetical protein RhiirA5_411350 [Rhizophagus irregularis]